MEENNIYGLPHTRKMDESSLYWSPSIKSSYTITGVRVLSADPITLSFHWSLVYKGQGEVMVTRDNRSHIVVKQLSSGFRVIGNEQICNLEISVTDDPSIFIYNSTHIVAPPMSDRFVGRIESYTMAGILGLGLIFQQEMDLTSTQIIRNQCILEP